MIGTFTAVFWRSGGLGWLGILVGCMDVYVAWELLYGIYEIGSRGALRQILERGLYASLATEMGSIHHRRYYRPHCSHCCSRSRWSQISPS